MTESNEIEAGGKARRKLAWWFWLMLFAPAVTSVALTACAAAFGQGEEPLGWMIGMNLLLALPLNGICAACGAVHLSRVRTGQTHPVWVVVGALGIFGLNVALAFAGCASGLF